MSLRLQSPSAKAGAGSTEAPQLTDELAPAESRIDMDERWWCSNCDLVTRLNEHLRCEFCGSDAVDIAVRPAKVETPTLDELERIWRKS
jgi:hypothetical protein